MPASGARATPLFHLYRSAMRLAEPLVFRAATAKLRAAGLPPARIAERRGKASAPRPDGPLVWLHAASVGESLAGLTLIRALAERLPQTSFLVTSGTATSADLIARRLPPRTRHHFAPIDAPGVVARFLDHWRPDAGIFVESELWPVMLRMARGRGVPLALVNARLSARSVAGWSRQRATSAYVLDAFAVMLTQNDRAADDLRKMGADPARLRPGTNLKALAPPLPVDAAALDAIGAALAGRQVWVASSTHEGEEEIVLAAHERIRTARPGAALLLAPRHPERGDAVERLIVGAGLAVARRSRGEMPGAGTDVYLADTLGELGTWYALSPIVFLGGSLRPIGGHNPFEPAQAGAAILTGPHVTNFTETFAPLIASGGAVETPDAPTLAACVLFWMEDRAALDAARTAAKRFATRADAALDEVIDTLCTALDLEGGRG